MGTLWVPDLPLGYFAIKVFGGAYRPNAVATWYRQKQKSKEGYRQLPRHQKTSPPGRISTEGSMAKRWNHNEIDGGLSLIALHAE